MTIQYVSNYSVVIDPVVRRGFLQLAPGQNEDGYGSKISTDYLVQLNKRQYRVYAVCFSNVASHYIIKGGKKLYLRDGEFEEAIEKANENLH